MTICKKCKQDKDPAAFAGGQKDWKKRDYWCNACTRQKQKEWRAKKPAEYFFQPQAQRYTQATFRPSVLFHAAKKRARLKNLEFSLTREWVDARLTAGHCEVTGLPFDLSMSAKKSGKRRAAPPYRPTIDRKNPEKGYTPDNSQMVIWAYNVAKFDFGHDALVEWVTAWMRTQPNLNGVYLQLPKMMGSGDDGGT